MKKSRFSEDHMVRIAAQGGCMGSTIDLARLSSGKPLRL